MDSNGNPESILYVERDISERKQAEADKEKMEARNRALEKAESLGRMAGAIAHNFNNLLGAVIANLDVATMKLSQGESPDTNITEAMRASNRAAEMSGLMLTYLGHSFEKAEPMDLSGACHRALLMLQAIVPENVALETELPIPGPVVMANTDQVSQVLNNLITNASETIGEGEGTIRLSVTSVFAEDIPAPHRFPSDWQSQTIAYACLEVSDTGCGIEDKDMEKLFDPFFSRRFTGRGMGLAVVLGVVRAHGGVVTVESEPGRGSAFRVFFPVVPDAS
jgi:signal transduction histidine kinase